MKLHPARAACAALISLALPAAASAQAFESDRYPAIATGLAIPGGEMAEALPRNVHIPDRGRFILVDASSARLFMIENGTVRDSMRVIVGKPSAATPSLQGMMYQATLNPYWNVPVDLAKSIIAPRVLADGLGYLESRGYQVVTGFRDDAAVLDPADVDWRAVADGTAKVHVRQLPGPANSMGQMKFGFANGNGIFLHDTPRKELFEEEERNLSNGCVRLEDAPRLARWLLGRDPQADVSEPEQRVALPFPVPIRITYLEPGASVQLASLR